MIDLGIYSDLLARHQVEALEKLSNGKILWGGVGTGKSRVAAAYYKINEAPRDVYVITTAKKRDDRDWEDEFILFGVGAKRHLAESAGTDPESAQLDVPDREGRKSTQRSRVDYVSEGRGNSVLGSAVAGTGTSTKNTAGTKRESSLAQGDRGPVLDGADLSEPSTTDGGSRASKVGAKRETALIRGRPVPVLDRTDQSQPGSRNGASGPSVKGASSVLRRGETEGVHRPREADGYLGSSSSGQPAGSQIHDLQDSGVVQGEGDTQPYALTVDSWNNIGKYAKVEGAFFIFDEQRLVGSGQWTKIFLKLAKRNNWLLLSATPGDTWMDYVPVFLANEFYPNRTMFKREHVIYNSFTKYPKVERYVKQGILIRHRNQLLVEMPMLRQTERVEVEVKVDFDKEALDLAIKQRWNPYTNEPMKDVAELFRVMRKIVNSDPSRIVAIRQLMRAHPKLIIFYNFDYELEALRNLVFQADDMVEVLWVETSTWKEKSESLLSSDSRNMVEPWATDSSLGKNTGSPFSSMTIGSEDKELGLAEWNGHKHQPIPQTDHWVYLVQYTAGAEGWNCIETDAMAFYSLHYSFKIWEQAKGRIDRLNTRFRKLFYYILMSSSGVDRAIWASLVTKQNFNENRYSKIFD